MAAYARAERDVLEYVEERKDTCRKRERNFSTRSPSVESTVDKLRQAAFPAPARAIPSESTRSPAQ